jgi:hypothetical protein
MGCFSLVKVEPPCLNSPERMSASADQGWGKTVSPWRLLVLPGLLAGLTVWAASHHAASAQQPQAPLPAPLPAQARLLSKPFTDAFPAKPYARNIWVMRLFNGRLYLGAGNSSNDPPSPNAGPVPLRYHRLTANTETTRPVDDATLEEEQIDRIVEIGNTLCIPGHDPREDWSFGNVHCLQQGIWIKHRTLPRVLHAYDLTEYKGAMVAAVSTKEGGGVAVSLDHGHSWSIKPVGYGRTYSLLKVDGRLYAVKSFQPARSLAKDPDNNYAVAEVHADWPALPPLDLDQAPAELAKAPYRNYAAAEVDPLWSVTPLRDLGRKDFFPDTPPDVNQSRKIIHTAELRKESYYIGADKHNDHQSLPFGLYRAAINQGNLVISRVPLPSNDVPWDIIHHGEVLYVLANTRVGAGYRIRIYGLTLNTGKWQTYAEIQGDTFARSLEADVKDDRVAPAIDFYLSLGCEVDRPTETPTLPPSCGDVLTYPYRPSDRP